MSAASRQNVSYFILTVITAVLTFYAYGVLNKEWVIFREAENNYSIKQYARAIPLYLEAGNKSTDGQLHLALSYVAMGKFKEAIPLYRNYLSLHPDNKEIRLELARALEWSGNLQESEAEYKKILEE